MCAIAAVAVWATTSTDLEAIDRLERSRYSASVTEKDIRVKNLERYLSKHKSPLYPYARIIVSEAEQNGIDYRLIPAIAMVESTLCRTIPNDSHNCWGWGVYGGKVTRFTSYLHAIQTISRGIREKYYDKGRDTLEEIAPVYNPNTPGQWRGKVERIFRHIEGEDQE
jgi:hypothetical protein